MDGFKEELAVSSVEPRNWKGIFIALLVILFICSIITAAIFIVSPLYGESKSKNERFKLEEVILDGYERIDSNVTWISSNKIVFRDSDGTVKSQVVSEWGEILASNASLARLKISKYSLSNDGKYLLLVHDLKPTNRYGYKAQYKIYSTINSEIKPLTIPGMPNDITIDYAEWGPTGTQMLVVVNRDIIYLREINISAPIHITRTGRSGQIYNGIPDVLYEEFILRDNKALWWNKDGSQLCYASFDNTHVDKIPIVIYGSSYNNTDDIRSHPSPGSLYFPKVINYPYPKPGRVNPVVSVNVANMRSTSRIDSIRLSVPSKLEAGGYYLKKVEWIDLNRLAIVWSNRDQNLTIVTSCDGDHDWRCNTLVEESLTSQLGWLDIHNAPLFSDDSESYFMIMPVADGPSGTYDHIIQFTRRGNVKRYHLTHGQYVVTKLYAHRNRTLYYQANIPEDAAVRHVYAIGDMDSEESLRRQTKCLSCDLGPDCLHNEAQFSPNGYHFILHCLGPGIPRTELRNTDTNEIQEVLNTFPELADRLAHRAMPTIRHLKVATDEQVLVPVKLLLPPGLNEDDSIKYPIIVRLNSQPDDQSVTHLNRLDWDYYLASKRDYIVASIDIRGSSFKGHAFEQAIFHNLGYYETHDILEVIKHLKSHVSYVEENKIALWGSEIGGYMVTSLMVKDPAFNCGIALSPVTSWRNYASYFMEQTMGLPSSHLNSFSYDKTDLFRELGPLREKAMMIIHGTADTKVNIQHSMLLMKQLTMRGIPFRVQLYPDADHSLFEERLHLYRTMEDFFARCFKSRDEQDEEEMDLPITRVIKGGKKIIIGDE
ncbi:inactive dipeptidyl peptidase 10-like [Brevipalpus obovatus]|uniref:inactive dipeptidyl peptidase 10-like n=1 Tax=Brevipalpus obovatus TaxID=246614 RepID=UPI003D9F6295